MSSRTNPSDIPANRASRRVLMLRGGRCSVSASAAAVKAATERRPPVCVGMIILAGFLLLSSALAAPRDEFRAANQLYDAGQFGEAAAAYEKIEAKNAPVYFNLGNAWFRQGKLGLALLNYDRARRLSPRDPDILANLKFAEQRLGVDEINASPKAIQRFLHNALASRTAEAWAAYEIAGLWLTVLAVAGWIWLPKLRTGFLVAALVGVGWFAVTAAALGWQVYADRTRPPAIVLAPKTAARFAPLPEATVHFQATEGTRVAVLEDRGQWLFIERADGQQGWVRADALGLVVAR